MKKITLKPEELRSKIEQYFDNVELKAKLNITAIAQSGSKIQYVRFEGVFNYGRILEIDIYFNDLLKEKISSTMKVEIPKYSNFGAEPSFWYLQVVDVTEKDGKYIVDGEFTYWPKYPTTNTLKYQAEVKVILDDFSVIKVIYEQNKVWYKLFPANDFNSN